ncbi:MAG TPA: TetR/AcrR family transcriptional regulator, partial [Deltaproteobacteria bacterium]|nr:TetR/AcrR family transcriptional regulator [Deltaproteobacteria bacterium]
MAGLSSKNRTSPGKKSLPRAPQQARSRRTRQKLIEAAVDCFERHGFDETTTAMIAARAGVAVGTVYNYFTDKREIILELLNQTDREVAEEVIAQLEPASWQGTTDPRERTRTLIDAIFHTQRLRPGIQRILWAQYFKDPDFREP